jgi:hypothetical protein
MCQKGIAEALLELCEVFKVTAGLHRMAESSRVWIGKLFPELAAAAAAAAAAAGGMAVDAIFLQQAAHGGNMPQHQSASDGSSSSTWQADVQAAPTSGPAASNAAAATAAAAQQELEQLLHRLLLHSATVDALPGGCRSPQYLSSLIQLQTSLMAAAADAQTLTNALLPPVPTSGSSARSSSK